MTDIWQVFKCTVSYLSCFTFAEFENSNTLKNNMTLSDLPVELLYNIFSYLSKEDIFWGIGLSCRKLLNVSLGAIPNFIELQEIISNYEDLMTFFKQNVFQWNEVRDIITCVVICDSIDNAVKTYETSRYISKYDGITLSLSCVSFSSDLQVSSFLSPLRNLMCLILDSLNWSPSDELFIELDKKYENLRYIQLAKATEISDEGMLYITHNKPKIQCIILHEAILLSNLSVHISSQNCNELKELKITWCRNLTDGAIIQLSKSCLRISTLHICGSHKITDRAIKELFLRFKDLVDVNISGCILVTDTSFQYLSESNIKIKKINLGGCRNITDAAVTYISFTCLHLEYLYLGGCIQVTDSGVTNLSNCKNLIGLSLGECSEIGDFGVSEICKHCRLLQNLILYRCQKVTDDGVKCIADSLLHLDTLDIRYCFRITDYGLSSIARNSKFLVNLYLDSAFYKKSSITKYQWYALFVSRRVSLSPLKGPFYDDE